MRETFLPFAPPLIGEEEIEEVCDTLRSGWLTTGPRAHRFEAEFARLVGAPSALAVNSGTAALHLALAAYGVGAGDSVVTTPLTFCSTAHVIEHCGATPVFADVETDTLNIDPARIEAAFESRPDLRPAGIVVVHYAGHPCDMGRIVAIAEGRRLPVVEDAAHALPASIGGRRIGPVAPDAVRSAACFSFYATKNLTTGEGGMLTGDDDMVRRARILALHGIQQDAWDRYGEGGSWYYEVVSAGFKYNMSDIQAAIGLHQLRKLASFHLRRTEIALQYGQAFAAVDELDLPTERADSVHAWHLYPLRLRLERLQIGRDEFIGEMARRRIGTSVHFIPLHLHPFYRDKYGYRSHDFPIAVAEYSRLVSLPIHPGMTDRDVEDVIAAVLDIVHAARVAR